MTKKKNTVEVAEDVKDFPEENHLPKLFRISVRLPHSIWVVGLAALDFRRRMKLLDSNTVKTSNYQEVNCRVDETFARLYFPQNAITVTREVSLAQLSAGDLKDPSYIKEGELSEYVYFNELSEERIKELWLAGTPV